MAFPGGTVVKEPTHNAEDTRDSGPIPGSGRSLIEEMVIPSKCCWKIPWAEEPIVHGISINFMLIHN